jgi:hypothetical protein
MEITLARTWLCPRRGWMVRGKMSEIHFFATETDLEEIWQLLFSDIRVVAFPDPHFGELPPPALRDVSAIAAHLRTYPLVAPGMGYFLVSNEWSSEPLVYKVCDFNPHFGRYRYVCQRYGGPAIHFIPRFGYPWKLEDSELISGMFGDYPSYYSALPGNEGAVIPRPGDLAVAMAGIRRGLCSRGGYVRSGGGRKAIALSGALEALERGARLRQGDVIYTAA